MGDTDPKVIVIRRYLAALGGGIAGDVLALFTPDGEVVSPLLGRLPAASFYARLMDSSQQSRFTVVDLMVSATDGPRAAAYFTYHWTLRDGTDVDFDCCDVFEFTGNVADPSVRLLTIMYDAAPVRTAVGELFHD
jgi:ketosteroid isomerase-like protein